MNMKGVKNALALAALTIACVGCAQSQSSGLQSSADGQVSDASAPPLEQMRLAQVSGKITVPVDVRYQFVSEPLRDQPTTLELAFVPRVQGQNLKIELPESKTAAVQTLTASMTQQKADANDAIRRQLLVTKTADGPAEIRVLVSMDVEGGRYFGVFTIPVAAEQTR